MIRHLSLIAATLLGLAASSPVYAAQGSGCIPTTGAYSGLVLVQDVNAALQALISNNSGGSAPVTDCSGAAVEGQLWVDTSAKMVRIFDGGNFLPLAKYDSVSHTLAPIESGLGSVTAAATTDLCSVTPAFVTVTGSGAIQSFGGSCTAGQTKIVRFASAGLTITASSNITVTGGASVVTQAGDTATASYLGGGVWSLSYQRATGVAVVIPSSPEISLVAGLRIANNSTTPDTKADITAASVVIGTAASSARFYNVAVTIDLTTVGANGLDAGSLASNQTLYNVFLVNNGTSVEGRASLSVVPSLPAGYTYVRVGTLRTDATSTPRLYRTLQRRGRLSYVVTPSTTTAALPIVFTGVIGDVAAPAYSPVSIASVVPPTAYSVYAAGVNAAGVLIIAPNPNYGAYNDYTNMTPQNFSLNGLANIPFSMLLEVTQTIYVASNRAASQIQVSGFEDSVPAI